MECRAFLQRALYVDFPMVHLYNLPHNWQPQTSPSNITTCIRLNASIAFEDLIQLSLWNAHPVVLHKEMNCVAFLLAPDQNRTTIRGILHSVAKQVCDDLCQLIAIALYSGHNRIQVHLNLIWS